MFLKAATLVSQISRMFRTSSDPQTGRCATNLWSTWRKQASRVAPKPALRDRTSPGIPGRTTAIYRTCLPEGFGPEEARATQLGSNLNTSVLLPRAGPCAEVAKVKASSLTMRLNPAQIPNSFLDLLYEVGLTCLDDCPTRTPKSHTHSRSSESENPVYHTSDLILLSCGDPAPSGTVRRQSLATTCAREPMFFPTVSNERKFRLVISDGPHLQPGRPGPKSFYIGHPES